MQISILYIQAVILQTIMSKDSISQNVQPQGVDRSRRNSYTSLSEENQEHMDISNDGAETIDHSSQRQFQTELLMNDNEEQNVVLSGNYGGQEENCGLFDNESGSVTNSASSLYAASRTQSDIAPPNKNYNEEITRAPECANDNIQDVVAPFYIDSRSDDGISWNRYGAGQNGTGPGSEVGYGINAGGVSLDDDNENEDSLNNFDGEQNEAIPRIVNGNIHVPPNDEDGQQNTARPLNNNDLRYIAQGISTSGLPGHISTNITRHVVHIRSLACGDLRLSETVEVWAWPFPDDV